MVSSTHCTAVHVLVSALSQGHGTQPREWSRRSPALSSRACGPPAARTATGGPLGISVDSVSEIVPHLIILHV